ncbi:MAG: hypothetical protein KJZ69_01325 [Phycisphaerales bacterium]|nr:hypothetical protein [Phycisphaerales bacterium]
MLGGPPVGDTYRSSWVLAAGAKRAMSSGSSRRFMYCGSVLRLRGSLLLASDSMEGHAMERSTVGRDRSVSLRVAFILFTSALGATAFGQECGRRVDFEFEAHSTTLENQADCAIAVGPSHILTTTNWGRRVWDRNGGLLVSETLEQFFGFPVFSDAVVAFDPDSARFFVLVMRNTVDSLALAVSHNSDPVDRNNWDFHQPPALPVLPDYPHMSVGAQQVFFSWQRAHIPTKGTAEIAWADKAALLNGQLPPVQRHFIDQIPNQDNTYWRAIGCFRMYEQVSPSMGYFITDSHTITGENNWVRLYALDAATNTLYEPFDLTVPYYRTAPWGINMPGGTINCMPFFKFPVYRNGSAWVVHAIGDDEPNTAKLRWHQIAMNGWPLSGNIPTLVQSGTIDPDDASASALFPAIHVDDAGNMAITYNECSPTQHIAIRRTIRKHYDAPGTTRAPITVRESTASPVNAAWADYSQMDEDPANPGVMWSHLEWFGINAVTPDLVEKRRTSVVRTDLNKSLTFEIGPEGPIRRGVTSVHLETRGAAPGGWSGGFTQPPAAVRPRSCLCR